VGVLDFEATCEKDKLINNQEIIEFPSVLYKVNNLNIDGTTFEYIDTFREFIKPVHNTQLSDFCKELTAITQEQVDNGDSFQNVLRRHIEWLQFNNVDFNNLIYVTCGAWDLKTIFPKNLILFKLERARKCYKRIINIKNEYQKIYKDKPRGLVNMLDFIGETFDFKINLF